MTGVDLGVIGASWNGSMRHFLLIAAVSGFMLLGFVLCACFQFALAGGRVSKAGWIAALACVGATAVFYDRSVLGWLAMLFLTELYLLFYAQDYTQFRFYCVGQPAVFALCVCAFWFLSDGGAQLDWRLLFPTLYFPLFFFLLLWRQGRGNRTLALLFFTLCAAFFAIGAWGRPLLANLCSLLLLCLLQYGYRGFFKSFQRTKAEFQNQVLLHHYQEVKAVYLNMRGWRHDYHNHIQSMKAYLAMGEYEPLRRYLAELEQDLKQVDELVKSGNLMADAVLNSKLSLAKEKQIDVNCKVIIPEQTGVLDVDLCVMLGNLLDNAIEACEKLPAAQRRIRIYGDVIHSQLYFSILNAAEEEPGWNQRQYISEKRGEHGHGMKRVKLVVEKYQGYLNLKNEPGVFVCELMLPLMGARRNI